MAQSSPVYTWKKDYNPQQTIERRIPPPRGYERIVLPENSFGEWLRNLPLKPADSPVYLYNGQLKGNQSAHFAVVDMDVGKSDLQQCADAIMRLRAEYLFSVGRFDAIHFNFTSGFNLQYAKWREGYRPAGYSARSGWRKSSKKDYSYENFRKYMTLVFSYAGTASLSKELIPISANEIRPGDVFIKGGFPGHAIIVLDMAQKTGGSEKVFIVGQSYMPAQEFHILKNYVDPRLDPWYNVNFGDMLDTPEWTFYRNESMRFSDN